MGQSLKNFPAKISWVVGASWVCKSPALPLGKPHIFSHEQCCRRKAERINSKNAIFAKLLSMESGERDKCNYCGGLCLSCHYTKA